MKFSNLFGLVCLSLFLANCSDDSEPVDPCPIVPEVPSPSMYQVAQLTINTENGAPIVSKDKKDYVAIVPLSLTRKKKNGTIPEQGAFADVGILLGFGIRRNLIASSWIKSRKYLD